MTEDKDIKMNLQYLDDIVSFLINSTRGYSLPFATLYKWKFGRELEEDKKAHMMGYLKSISEHQTIEEFFENVSDNTLSQGEKLVEALYYLDSQGVVRLDQQFNIKLTFNGIIKHSNGYLKEHLKNAYDYDYLRGLQKVQKRYQILSLVFSSFALIISILGLILGKK